LDRHCAFAPDQRTAFLRHARRSDCAPLRAAAFALAARQSGNLAPMAARNASQAKLRAGREPLHGETFA